MSDSEFGDVLGDICGGHVISSEGNPKREDGTIIFISSAFNPLTREQLREILDFMDEVDPANEGDQWKSN
jgi:hypothetical protein